MSDSMSGVSCVSVTTLVVVSLANLILLIVMVMESRKNCSGDAEYTDTFRLFGGSSGSSGKFSSLVSAKNTREEPKFMAALTLYKSSGIVLVCGTTIISKFWVLTSAQCCETVKIYSFDRLKISSNSPSWRNGIKHSVENLVRHVNYTSKSVTHNVCLIKVGSPFREKYEITAFLAGSQYKYKQDSAATTLGWSLKSGKPTKDQLYYLKVNLIAFQRCKTLLNNGPLDETMVCAYDVTNLDCSFDSGGPLVQNNVVIGIASFEPNCAAKTYPRVFTRISYFENWFKQVEKQTGLKIGANFKN